MPFDLQTIIVKKKQGRRTLDRDSAQKVADKHAKKAIYTSRETGQSFRFRQRPPSDFVDDSFRTAKLGDHVSLVYGKLKRGKKPLGKRRRNPESPEDTLYPQDVIHYEGRLPDPGPCAWLGDATQVCWIRVGGTGKLDRQEWEDENGWMMLWSPLLSAVICVPKQELQPSPDTDEDTETIVKRFNKRNPRGQSYCDIPAAKLDELGKAKHIVYRSDKWNPGTFHDYIHDFQAGVRCFADNPIKPKVIVICGGRLTVTERGLIY
jgi:hypothetical protein